MNRKSAFFHGEEKKKDDSYKKRSTVVVPSVALQSQKFRDIYPKKTVLSFVLWYWSNYGIDPRTLSSSNHALKIREALNDLEAHEWNIKKLEGKFIKIRSDIQLKKESDLMKLENKRLETMKKLEETKNDCTSKRNESDTANGLDNRTGNNTGQGRENGDIETNERPDGGQQPTEESNRVDPRF